MAGATYRVSSLARCCSNASNVSRSVMIQVLAEAGDEPRQSRPDTGRRQAYRGPDLFGGEPGQVAHGNQCPVVWTKSPEGGAQVQSVSGRHGARADHLGVAERGDLSDATPAAGSDVLPRLVRRDRDQPGPKPIGLSDAGQALPGLDPGELSRIQGRIEVAGD